MTCFTPGSTKAGFRKGEYSFLNAIDASSTLRLRIKPLRFGAKPQAKICQNANGPAATRGSQNDQNGMPWLQELQEYGANKAANKAANHQW